MPRLSKRKKKVAEKEEGLRKMTDETTVKKAEKKKKGIKKAKKKKKAIRTSRMRTWRRGGCAGLLSCRLRILEIVEMLGVAMLRISW